MRLRSIGEGNNSNNVNTKKAENNKGEDSPEKVKLASQYEHTEVNDEIKDSTEEDSSDVVSSSDDDDEYNEGTKHLPIRLIKIMKIRARQVIQTVLLLQIKPK